MYFLELIFRIRGRPEWIWLQLRRNGRLIDRLVGGLLLLLGLGLGLGLFLRLGLLLGLALCGLALFLVGLPRHDFLLLQAGWCRRWSLHRAGTRPGARRTS